MPAQDLRKIANELRLSAIIMASRDLNIHLAGSLSSADIFSVMYFGDILRYHPDDPWNEQRDRFILSCGHYAPILYASLSFAGFFAKDMLETIGRIGGLPIHPEHSSTNENVPGIEASTGPLGQGLSVAVGVAIALKKKRSQARVYCLASDGEMQEGQAWEALSLAVREKLDNLVILIDNNNVQIEHYVTELAGEASLVSKCEAFGCHTIYVDGNDLQKLESVLQSVKQIKGRVVVVVAKTIGGKGVSFMENLPKWHDGKITKEQFEIARRELLELKNPVNGDIYV